MIEKTFDYLAIPPIILTGLFGIIMAFNFPEKQTEIVHKTKIVEKIVDSEKTEPFSEYAMLMFLKEMKADHIAIIMTQAKMECGFTSNIFRENHNLFGMQLPKRRQTTAIGENRGCAVYENWKMCVIDYIFWQNVNGKGLTEEAYIALLMKKYAKSKYPMLKEMLKRTKERFLL